LKFCRGNDYYVDADSKSVIELGTLDHPFKYLGLPFVEIFNL